MYWAGWNDTAHALALGMADASLRALALAALAALLAGLVRRNPAARHTVWTLVLAGMLVLPFLRPIMPAAHVPLPRRLMPQVLNPMPMRSGQALLRVPSLGLRRYPSPPPTKPWLWIAAAYLTGFALFSARLVIGFILARRALRDTRVIHPASPEYFDRITFADPEVVLEESDSVPVPLAIGLVRVRVILPSGWRRWPKAKLDAILAHELTHARRSDPWIAFLASLNTCLFWFHPLAWWLRRELAVLAEHSADDAALANSPDRASYARLLLETAAQLPKNGSRLAWHSAAPYSVAMTGPVVAQRIRRVLKLDLAQWKPLGAAARTMLVVTTAALILLTTAVDVKTLAAGQSQVEFYPATATQAAAWERALAANPGDQKTREQLIIYYAIHQQPDRALPHILWLIDHHPESQFAGFAPPLPTRDQLDELKSHWAAQLAVHTDDAWVLINAAHTGDLDEQMNLLERARHLDPSRATEPLAHLYSQILLSNAFSAQNAGLAAQVRFKVQSSNNIALVGAVAQYFVEGAARNALTAEPVRFSDARALATELVTHAEAVDPGSGWSDLMQGVQALPER
jgi:beta-lactamase regulating signal transducer with metallopeptidase domain